jgi:hypothetical protein
VTTGTAYGTVTVPPSVSVAVGIVGLLIARDELRSRLRPTTPTGIPLATEATVAIAAYLAAERDLGRLAADADVDVLADAEVDVLAPTLVGPLISSTPTATPRQPAPEPSTPWWPPSSPPPW